MTLGLMSVFLLNICFLFLVLLICLSICLERFFSECVVIFVVVFFSLVLLLCRFFNLLFMSFGEVFAFLSLLISKNENSNGSSKAACML